jgi:hypothetical protein
MTDEPQTESTLSDERIAEIKKAAAVNTLNSAYNVAVQQDMINQDADIRIQAALQDMVNASKTNLLIWCPNESETHYAAIILDYEQDGGCDCCGSGAEYLPTAVIYCTSCFTELYSS